MRSNEGYAVTCKTKHNTTGNVTNPSKQDNSNTIDTTIPRNTIDTRRKLVNSHAEEEKSKDVPKIFKMKDSFSQENSEVSAFKFTESNQERVKHLRSKIAQEPSLPESNNSTPATSKEVSEKNVIRTEVLPGTYSIVKITNLNIQGKRASPESSIQDSMEKYRNGDVFQCVHCSKCFRTGQALGGHMSRKHSGKSIKYNHKKKIRQTREFERMKLCIAKKKFFASLGYDYEAMMQTPDGKMRAKALINRSKIKRIKSHLTEEEVSNYFKG